jgi:hypothetical protein
MKLLKTIILSVALISLFSCSERLSPKRSDAGQQQVKQQVVKSLEEYYKQPFKLEDFKYEYKKQYPSGNCQGASCNIIKLGTYTFKIKAVDNPIIKIDLELIDNKEFLDKNEQEESINRFILYRARYVL